MKHFTSACAARFAGTWAVLCLLVIQPAAAADKTDYRTTELDTVVVSGTQESLGQNLCPVAAGELMDQVLRNTPFRLIRRGNGSVSDLYSDGLKRNDIRVTIDGERCTTACPNRMDTRVGMVNLLDIQAVDMSRSSATLQSGLGGQMNFRRRLPGSEEMIYGQIMGAFDHSDEFTGNLAIEGNRKRFSGRFNTYKPYTDAANGTFSERYHYAQEAATTTYQLRGHMAFDQGDAVASYDNSEDVLFPYLLMDERTNDLYQGSVAYQGHRLYFNHTEHRMDNYLRKSFRMTDMVTEARNSMFGVVGKDYEVFARHWDADNFITPLANPMMGKTNHMLPDVWRLGASYKYEVGDKNHPWLFLRAGLAHTGIGDEDQLALYRILQPEAETDHWSFPVGITATRQTSISDHCLLALSAEVSSDAPSIEQQYIATDKPGTKPDWVGNPELKDPLRATGRLAIQRSFVQLEMFATRVWNYPYLVKRSASGAMFLTYDGVDAWLAGANLSSHWRYFEAGASWNWGEKIDDQSPLSEIQPLTVFVGGDSPAYQNITANFLYRHSAGQGRVDNTLDEDSTGAWNRLDLGLSRKAKDFTLALVVENATNALYSQHLSYQRNPFASGIRVYEPGRVYRATATFKF